MTDREKKIEEIEKSLAIAKSNADGKTPESLQTWSDGYYSDVSFLLADLKRLQQEIKSHAPEGRNYTNLQYVTLQQERDKAVEELKEAHRQMDNARLIISKLGVSL